MANLLIIASECNEASRLTSQLLDAGHKVVHVNSLRRGLAQLELIEPAITFCFHPLQEIDGPGCVAGLLSKAPDARIIIVCPFAQSQIAAEAIKNGASDYLPTPLDPSEVAACTDRALHSETAERSDPVRFEASAGALIMTFPVEVSFAVAEDLNRLINTGLVVPKNGLILDLSQTTHVSSAGIGSLLLLCQKFGSINLKPVVSGASSHIHKVLQLAGAETLFIFHHSIDHALSYLKARS